MKAFTRIKPSEHADVKCHWYQVMYQDRFGKVHRVGGINSRIGAEEWADRLNEEPGNRYYWAEPNPNMPGRDE